MKNIFILLLLPAICLISCRRSFEPIHYGTDACAHCKMTIMDKRFAAELVTANGKVFKFDDLICMRQFIQGNQQQPNALYFVNDYQGEKAIALDASKAVYLQHELFKSPMNGNYAAFAGSADAQRLKDSLQTDLLTWETIK